MPTPTRLRTPVLVAASLVLGLLVVGGILLVGSLGTTQPEPSPSLQVSATPSPAPATVAATDPLSTPEGAVRAFFAALKEARRTDDAAADPPTSSPTSSRRRTSRCRGSSPARRPPTRHRPDDPAAREHQGRGDRRHGNGRRSTYTEGGYDISLDRRVAARVTRDAAPARRDRAAAPVDGRWLVDALRGTAAMSRRSALVRLGAAPSIAVVLLAVSATTVLAIDSGVDVTGRHLGGGRRPRLRRRPGRRARWARPGTRSCIAYYSTWDHRTTIFTDPVRDQWAVKVHTCSGSTVNPLSPTMVITSRVTPGIGVRADTSGVLSLDLGVAVDPETAPAGTDPDRHGRPDRRMARGRRRSHPRHHRPGLGLDPALDRRLR